MGAATDIAGIDLLMLVAVLNIGSITIRVHYNTFHFFGFSRWYTGRVESPAGLRKFVDQTFAIALMSATEDCCTYTWDCVVF